MVVAPDTPGHTPGSPAAGGEMGRLVRTTDWAATPLGPMEDWPQSLRTITDTLLAGALPIVLLWGPTSSRSTTTATAT